MKLGAINYHHTIQYVLPKVQLTNSHFVIYLYGDTNVSTGIEINSLTVLSTREYIDACRVFSYERSMLIVVTSMLLQ